MELVGQIRTSEYKHYLQCQKKGRTRTAKEMITAGDKVGGTLFAVRGRVGYPYPDPPGAAGARLVTNNLIPFKVFCRLPGFSQSSRWWTRVLVLNGQTVQ
eukprot:scaffold194962_cov15-Prasinocladus_malaysianus.AAC.1